MKIKRKLNMEHPYNIEEYESWLSYNAERGLFLKSIGERFSDFWVGTPQKIKYRVDIIFEGLTPERRELYEEAGWKLVDSKGIAYIFCAPEFKETIEIDTDKEEIKQKIKKFEIKRRIYFILTYLFSILYVSLFMFIANNFFKTPYLDMLKAEKVLLNCFYILILITILLISLYYYRNIRRLSKKIKKGFEINHNKKWKNNFWRKGVYEFGYLLIVIFYSISFPFFISNDKSNDYINSDSIRILSILEIENINDYVEMEVSESPFGPYQNKTRYTEYTNRRTEFFLKNHFYFYEEVVIPEKGEKIVLEMDYYDLLSEFQAKGVFDDLIKYYQESSYIHEVDTVDFNKMNNDYFDEVIYADNLYDKEIFIRKANIVIELRYDGEKSVEYLLGELEESF